MDERDQERQLVDAQTKGSGRLRGGVEMARGGVEDVAWFLRERAWAIEDGFERLGRRGAIGVFGGGGLAGAGLVAAVLIASAGGSDSHPGTAEAFVVPPPAPAAKTAPAAAPQAQQKAKRPDGPTLHGAPPDFSPGKDAKAGGKAAERRPKAHGSGGIAAGQTPKPDHAEAHGKTGKAAATSAADAPAAAAKIGSTPQASAAARAEASSLATGEDGAAAGDGDSGLRGPPAPRAAKQVARRFAEAFVGYEVGGIDGQVRKDFRQTATRQLSRSLLHRPPRQPASVKVPRAKVVNVVAGPSRGSVYTVSVSLLRVGVTSELRLEMERGVGRHWQVTNVLG